MKIDNQDLELPPVPRRILDSVLPFLIEVMPCERILLGGGTALAARWQHRESYDVDLFVNPVDFNELIYLRTTECEGRLAELGTGRLATIGPEGLEICCVGGRVDIVGCFPLTENSRSRDRVAGGRIGVETNVEILAKKLHRRIIGHGQIVPRDLYDMAFARRFEPATMDAAWMARRIVDPDVLIAALSSFSPGWMERQEERVQGARHPELETGAVEDMLDDVRSRFPSDGRDRRASRDAN